jgi:hypothetical protein
MEPSEALNGFDYDPRQVQYQYNSRLSWPMHQTEPHQSQTLKRSTSPLPLQANPQSYQQTASHPAPTAAMMREWHMTSQGPTTSYSLDTAPFPQQPYEQYGVSFQNSPLDYMPPHPSLEVSMEANMGTNMGSNMGSNMGAVLNMEAAYLDMSSNINQMATGNMNQMTLNWADMNDLIGYPHQPLPDMTSTQPMFPVGSPGDAYLSENQLEVRSLSSSDNDWMTVEHLRYPMGAISNPEQTLHPRTFSDSSYSDVDQRSRTSMEYVEIPPFINSPGTDSLGDTEFYSDHAYYDERTSPPAVATSSTVQPIAIRQPTSPQQPPTSPTARRQSRKNPTAKSTSKAVARRSSHVAKVDTEKRVGRRKGPLRPEQRKQACEIRKLGACLRCKFLKKTVSHVDFLAIENKLIPHSVILVSLAQAARRPMRVYGWCHALGLISRISVTL